MTLAEILGLRFPIIQGGMANIATGEFAAAASNAGALGIIGSGGMDADTLLKHIRRAKELTDRPFGVNLMLMNPDCDAMAQVFGGRSRARGYHRCGQPCRIYGDVEGGGHKGAAGGIRCSAGQTFGKGGRGYDHCRRYGKRRPRG